MAKRPKPPAAPPTSNTDLPSMPKLTLKERAFVTAIATPGSPAFSNATEATIQAGYSVPNRKEAGRQGWDLRRQPRIESAIDEVFRKHQLGIEVRSAAIKEILEKPTTDIEYRDGDGKLLSTTRMTNAKHILGAISLLNKMDGTYARAEAIGHAQGKVLEPIVAEYTRRLRAELKAPPQQDAVQADTETGIAEAAAHAEALEQAAMDAAIPVTGEQAQDTQGDEGEGG